MIPVGTLCICLSGEPQHPDKTGCFCTVELPFEGGYYGVEFQTEPGVRYWAAPRVLKPIPPAAPGLEEEKEESKEEKCSYVT